MLTDLQNPRLDEFTFVAAPGSKPLRFNITFGDRSPTALRTASVAAHAKAGFTRDPDQCTAVLSLRRLRRKIELQKGVGR